MTFPARPSRIRRVCWLSKHGHMEHGDPMTPCDGELIRAHLIPKQLLIREGLNPMDPRTFVWACGGPTGLGGHHGMLDQSRKLRVAREALPALLEQFAFEQGLGWYLDRTYLRGAGKPLEAAPPGAITSDVFQGAIPPDQLGQARRRRGRL
jgi:hypothetical protein